MTSLDVPTWWVEPSKRGEYGIQNVTNGHVDELHVNTLQEAAEALLTVREAIPALVRSLAAQEAAGTATAQLRMVVAAEQAARYRVVHRNVGSWEEVR